MNSARYRAVWFGIFRWLLLYLAGSMLAAILALALIRIFTGDVPGRAGLDSLDEFQLALFLLITGGGGLAVTLACWRRLDGLPLPAIWVLPGAGAPRAWLAGGGLGLILALAAALPALLTPGCRIEPVDGGAGTLLVRLAAPLAPLLVLALNEEVGFRGYLLRRMLLVARPPVAVALCSLIFAAFHAGNPNLTPLAGLNLCLAGVLLGVAFLTTRRLAFVAACHLTWNFGLGVLISVPVSGVALRGVFQVQPAGPAWWSGGLFGPEGSVAATLALAVATLLMVRRGGVDWRGVPSALPGETGVDSPPPETQGPAPADQSASEIR